MLLQLIAQHPQALAQVVKNTPVWVWGLLAGLTALGLSQLRTRTVGALRTAIIPVAMTGLSLYGMVFAFGASPLLGYVLLAWLIGAAVMMAVVAPMAAPANAAYDSAQRSFRVPGSLVPLMLILGIFLTKYVVGVDLAMQPGLAQDGTYTVIVGGLYGAFSGIFAGRAARLGRLAFRPATPIATTPGLSA